LNGVHLKKRRRNEGVPNASAWEGKWGENWGILDSDPSESTAGAVRRGILKVKRAEKGF